MEQNYRSTANILNAANAVISHNHGRKDKTLWTDNEDGDKIAFRQFDTAFDEAEYIVIRYKRTCGKGRVRLSGQRHFISYECTVPYVRGKICNSKYPYKIIGGINSMQDREIKDILAYLKTVDNGQDDGGAKNYQCTKKRNRSYQH